MTTSGQIGTFDPITLDTLTVTGINQIQPLTAANITALNHPYNSLDIASLDTYQGEMVVAEMTIPDSDAMITGMSAAGFREEVKKKLIYLLAEQLMKNKLIEFTSQQFAHSNDTKFRARIYAVPDQQIRMIRKNMP